MKGSDKASIPDPTSEQRRRRPGVPARLWGWIDQRTGVDRALRRSLDEPIPGGARLAYVFGSALLFIFVSQVVTGLCLALYYVPAPELAHVTVAYIVKEVAAGAFLRSLHSYGSSAMVVVLLLHFLQTFLYGAYKGKRQLLWISGCVLALLVLGMAFTGYLLSWDQSAYSAGSVGTDLVGKVPFIGESLSLLLRGGAAMGALTLSRFYILHILLIPALIFAFVATHLMLFRKAGPAGPVSEDSFTPRLPTEPFYPKQVLIDLTFVLLVMGALGMLAHFVPVTLGLPADPSNTTYVPRPEWYFLPMFQWLKSWEGWSTVIGVFVIPLVLGGLVFALPFLDRGLERRPWRRPIPVGAVLIVVCGALWLGMSSRLADSRDPDVATQLAQQAEEERAYFHQAFKPYSPSASSSGSAPDSTNPAVASGKGLFDSHGCSGCHGADGAGAKGPALTHITSKFPPAELAALLKAPTAAMKAGGMAPVTLDATEFKALDSYLTSLGGPSAGAAAAPTSATTPAAPAASSTAPPGSPPAPVASASVARASTAATPTIASGKDLFESQGCSGCHGAGGVGAKGPALTHITSKYPPKRLAALLKAPTPAMKAGGMVALTLDATQLKELTSYLASLGAAPAAAAPAPPSVGAASPGSTTTSAPPNAAASGAPASHSGPTAQDAEARPGKSIYESQGCASCHGAGATGTSRAPALTDVGKRLSATQVTSLLRAPNAQMKAGGMPAVTVTGQELTSLVTYLRSLDSATGASGPTGSSPTPTANSAAGKKIYATHCADCHGPHGKGDGTVGRALKLRPTDFIATPSDDTEWLEAIRHGSKAAGKMAGMKAFAGELTDGQIHDVLAYLKTLHD